MFCSCCLLQTEIGVVVVCGRGNQSLNDLFQITLDEKQARNIPQLEKTAWDNPKHRNIKAQIAVKNYTYVNCYWLYFGRQEFVPNQLNGVGCFKKNYFLIWFHVVAGNSVTSITFYLRCSLSES